MRGKFSLIILLFVVLSFSACTGEKVDLVIRNGLIVDGSGGDPYMGGIAVHHDTIYAVGDLGTISGQVEINAAGMVISPGFINMLSWANESLIQDGKSQGDIRQGVTLEVMGEGFSMGPLNEEMKIEMIENQEDIKFEVNWNTLGEYLRYLENKGVSPNIASFVGNATLRQYVMGYENREPSEAEMNQMKVLLREAMEEGAMGLSSSLIYVPSGHASTGELIELARITGEYGGMYVSHIRNEEEGLLEAVNELITTAAEANIRAEIYHFKASGTNNWHLLDSAIDMIDRARSRGLGITTDMYTYNASSTGLNIGLPLWAREGGHEKTMALIRDPVTRAKMIDENVFHVSSDKILLVGFKNPALRKYLGKTLEDVSKERGTGPSETAVDLIYEDNSRIQVVYFSMADENIAKKMALPYMSICSDAGSYAAEGIFLNQSTHPRAYGSFARVLGKYVRDEGVISLSEGIYKMTGLPASNLGLEKRGLLRTGYFADLVVFDPETVGDLATFEKPHQYATGIIHVWVNGEQVLRDGEHTGALPGRFIKGPGFKTSK